VNDGTGDLTVKVLYRIGITDITEKYQLKAENPLQNNILYCFNLMYKTEVYM
jgi:hypothetical protein